MAAEGDDAVLRATVWGDACETFARKLEKQTRFLPHTQMLLESIEKLIAGIGSLPRLLARRKGSTGQSNQTKSSTKNLFSFEPGIPLSFFGLHRGSAYHFASGEGYYSQRAILVHGNARTGLGLKE